VNDNYGHAAGDALLKAIAERLIAVQRETDTVARLGGDEFAVILNNLDQPEHAHVPAGRIVDQLSPPYRIDGRDHDIGASIGLSIFPRDDTDPEELLRKADMAMYQAKEARSVEEPHEKVTAIAV
jgi:diguanylate cyclase (GGDEF)-like protein